MSTSIGLVVRSRTVDLIEVRRGLNSFRLSKVISVPTNGSEDVHMVEAIRTAMANVSGKAFRVGVTFVSHDILLRAFVMPLLPKVEREAGVGFEVRKYIPFKTEDLEWNCHITQRRAARQMHVVFVGVKAQLLERLRGWLREAGVAPAFIEGQSISLSRVIADPTKGTPAPACVGVIDVDLVGNVAHIVVVKDRVPYFSRDVRLQDQAEAMANGTDAPDARAKLLLGELRLSLDFFARENPAVPVERLLLFGDPAMVGSWVSWLAEQLNRPVTLGTLPMTDQRGFEVPPQYACVVGLALKGVRRPRLALEFARHKLLVDRRETTTRAPLRESVPDMLRKLAARARRTVTAQFTKALAMQVSAAACLLAVLIGLGAYQVQQAKAQSQRILTALTHPPTQPDTSQPRPRQPLQGEKESFFGLEKPETPPVVITGLEGRSRAELQSLKEGIETRLSLLQATLRQRVLVTEKLALLTTLIPDGVWLDGLTFSSNPDSRQVSMKILGSCFLPESRNELEVIGEFSSQLKRHQAFFQGFRTSQLGEISIRPASVAGAGVTYRTFTVVLQGEGISR